MNTKFRTHEPQRVQSRSQNRAWPHTLVGVGLMGAGLVIGLLVGLQLQPAQAKQQRQSPYRKLAVFARVLGYLETEYVDPVNRERVIEDAVRGLLRRLDPHTQYFTASQVKQLRAVLTGRYTGVGLSLARRKRSMVVLNAVPGGPAGRAGLRPGDRLLSIDGRSVRDLDLATVTTKLRGRRGTRVVLQIQPLGSAKARRVVLVRDVIRNVDVSKTAFPGGIGYIAVRRFSHGAARQVLTAIKQLRQAFSGRLRAIVLDLRDNPGGLMDEGIRLADHFIARGLLVRKIGKRGRLRESEYAHAKGTLSKLRLVVLINHGTASAAEIVAAALQDHRRAFLVGQQSFGKGSMQSIIPLPDGSRLKLTIARYYRPSGKAIQGLGVKPSIALKVRPGERPLPPVDALSAPAKAIRVPNTLPTWAAADPALWRAYTALRKP